MPNVPRNLRCSRCGSFGTPRKPHCQKCGRTRSLAQPSITAFASALKTMYPKARQNTLYYEDYILGRTQSHG